MKNLINRIQRELPDTDKNRYDAAYERGRAQAKSGPLFGGLAFGALVGAGLMFLLDPDRGAERRARLASRATGARNDLARTAGGRIEDLQDRAKDTNGTSHAVRPADPDAPGANVPDPIKPEEVQRYGASGPIAGATLVTEPAEDREPADPETSDLETGDREAERASGSNVGG